jgi:hypothetical protein
VNGSDAGSAGQWAAVWQQAGSAVVVEAGQAAECRSTARPEANSTITEDKEGESMPGADLVALFVWAPAPAYERPPLVGLDGAASQELSAAVRQGNRSDDGPTPPLLASWTTGAGVEARPAGSMQPEAPLLEQPAPSGAQAEQAAAPPPTQQEARGTSQCQPERLWPAEPVADVLLRPSHRLAQLPAKNNASIREDSGTLRQGMKAALSTQDAMQAQQSRIELRVPASVPPGGVRQQKDYLAGSMTVPSMTAARSLPTGMAEASGDGRSRVIEDVISRDEGSRPQPNDWKTEAVQTPAGTQAEPVHQAPQNPLRAGEPQAEQAAVSAPSGPSPHERADWPKQPAAADPPAAAAQLEPAEAEPQEGPARLGGQLDLQVDGRMGQRVRIRLSEAPGGVRLRVASSDARLAESLRSEWQSLEAALRRTGWEPQMRTLAAAGPAEAGMSWGGGHPGTRHGGETGTGHRAAAPVSGQTQGQEPAGDSPQREGHSGVGYETREEWLDLSALRRLARRRQS